MKSQHTPTPELTINRSEADGRNDGTFLKHLARKSLKYCPAKHKQLIIPNDTHPHVTTTNPTRDAFSGMGGPSSCTIRNSAVMGARSKYGGFPVNSSMTVQPTLHTSHAADIPDISITSGATDNNHTEYNDNTTRNSNEQASRDYALQ